MEVNWLALGGFVLGALARVFVPWLVKRYRYPDDPDSKWTWRKVWPQFLGFGIVLVVSPVIADDPEAINTMKPVMAYMAGWGVADFAKTMFLDVPDAAKNGR